MTIGLISTILSIMSKPSLVSIESANLGLSISREILATEKSLALAKQALIAPSTISGTSKTTYETNVVSYERHIAYLTRLLAAV